MTNPIYIKQLKAINQQIADLAYLYLQTIKLLYTNLAPPGFVNYFAENIQLDLSIFPELFQFFSFQTENEVNSVVCFYANKTEDFIAFIRGLGYENALNDKLYQAKCALVTINNLASALLEQEARNVYSYTLPYSMSLRMVMWLNKLDFNQASQVNTVFRLNRGVIQSVNALPRGLLLSLPKVNHG